MLLIIIIYFERKYIIPTIIQLNEMYNSCSGDDNVIRELVPSNAENVKSLSSLMSIGLAFKSPKR